MSKASALGPPAALRGLCRMNTERAQRGYRLTQFLTSMREPTRRAAFAADPEACMAQAGLTPAEQDMVRRRDYDAMLDHGASNVAIGKASGALGTTLVARGAKGRGQTPEEFIAERKLANQGQPWQF